MHRSYLYVPGDRPDRIAKALASGADAVIADLEDGVSPAARPAAREHVAEALRSRAEDHPEMLVRVNNDPDLGEDLAAVVPAGCRSVYLPKADLASLERLSSCWPADAPGADVAGADGAGADVAVVALIESATGVLEAAELARHPLVRNLAIGEADLTAELAVTPSPDGRELWAVRSALVVASAAAGIDPPTGPVSSRSRAPAPRDVP